MVKNTLKKDLITFFLIAIVGASVNFFSRKILYSKFFPFALSEIPSYFTGMVIGFVLTKQFAFNAKGSGNTRREMVKYVIITIIALGVTIFTSVPALYALNTYFPSLSLSLRESIAHLTGMGFSFVANFIGHKLFTFRSTGMYNRVTNKQ